MQLRFPWLLAGTLVLPSEQSNLTLSYTKLLQLEAAQSVLRDKVGFRHSSEEPQQDKSCMQRRASKARFVAYGRLCHHLSFMWVCVYL